MEAFQQDQLELQTYWPRLNFSRAEVNITFITIVATCATEETKF